jgi:hypothetical protein
MAGCEAAVRLVLIFLGLVLVLCFVIGAVLARTGARTVLIRLSTLLVIAGFGSVLLLSYGPRDLWQRLQWLPHPWLTGAFGVLAIAIGASVLLGIATPRALGLLHERRPR